jgi:8-oxo-dGTP diphosphatase
MEKAPMAPVLCVGLFCKRGDEILLIKRSKPPRTGAWTLPGGRVEFGERCEDAAARELYEEVNLAAAALRRIGLHEFIEDQYHLVVIIFACKLGAGVPNQGGDAAEVRWWRQEDIPKLPHTEGLMLDSYSAFEKLQLMDPGFNEQT